MEDTRRRKRGDKNTDMSTSEFTDQPGYCFVGQSLTQAALAPRLVIFGCLVFLVSVAVPLGSCHIVAEFHDPSMLMSGYHLMSDQVSDQSTKSGASSVRCDAALVLGAFPSENGGK